MELDRTERRLLGALMEKRWSTPDQYPLSLNALVAACNQKSNRDPVFRLEEFEVTGCILALGEKGLVLIRERDGGRVQRYAEKLTEELGADRLRSAILAELLLRGPQTAGELSRRVPRMAPAGDAAEVEATLVDLADGHLARRLPKAAGQRHPRWTHLLAPEEEAPPEPQPAAPEPPATAPPAPEAAPPPPPDEIHALREEILALRRRVERLEERLREG